MKETEDEMRFKRTTGEFYTPLEYAFLAHQHLSGTIPDRYGGQGTHHSMYDDYNWWDPCCGIGNLTFNCPPDMGGKLFMSTLNQEDVDVIMRSGQNPNAEIFQYDFLNQGTNELPKSLRDAFEDGKPWIFILNPPFVAGTDADDGRPRASATPVGKKMLENGLGMASRNPMMQFLFRISELFSHRDLEGYVGRFVPPVVFCGEGSSKLRKHISDITPTISGISGFAFPCSEFQGTKGEWPVTFSIGVTRTVLGVEIDVMDESEDGVVLNVMEHIGDDCGIKAFAPSKDPLTKWVDRPRNTVMRPPMNGALGIVEGKSVQLDKLASEAIGYLRWQGNDVQNSVSRCHIVSGPHSQGYGWAITPDNFHDSMVSFAVRRLVNPTWINWQDQFSVPDQEHPDYEQWALDAIVWVLFERKNQASSLGDVIYKGESYDIPNHFFWLTPEEMSDIPGLPRPIWQQCRLEKPRFVSSWLQDQEFSNDAFRVLDLGKELVRTSVPFRMDAHLKFQLGRYDAGWYQIRMGLYGEKDVPFSATAEMIETMEKFKKAHKDLGDRLRPMIYELGFLPKEISIEETD